MLIWFITREYCWFYSVGHVRAVPLLDTTFHPITQFTLHQVQLTRRIHICHCHSSGVRKRMAEKWFVCQWCSGPTPTHPWTNCEIWHLHSTLCTAITRERGEKELAGVWDVTWPVVTSDQWPGWWWPGVRWRETWLVTAAGNSATNT